MAKYGSFKYDSGTKYGREVVGTSYYRALCLGDDRGVVARHLQVVFRHTSDTRFRMGDIRARWSRKAHVVPKWLVPVGQMLKRTQVIFKLRCDEAVRIDSIRLKQTIKARGKI